MISTYLHISATERDDGGRVRSHDAGDHPRAARQRVRRQRGAQEEEEVSRGGGGGDGRGEQDGVLQVQPDHRSSLETMTLFPLDVVIDR